MTSIGSCVTPIEIDAGIQHWLFFRIVVPRVVPATVRLSLFVSPCTMFVGIAVLFVIPTIVVLH